MWTTAKIVSLLVIFWLSFLSGITSCVLVHYLRRKFGVSSRLFRTISVLNCFSGGVFFATSILHLLPEAREKLVETLELWGIETEYPLTEVLTGVGFLFILCFENISQYFCSGENVGKATETINGYDTCGKEGYNPPASITYTKVPTDECDIKEEDGDVHIIDPEDEIIAGNVTYQREALKCTAKASGDIQKPTSVSHNPEIHEHIYTLSQSKADILRGSKKEDGSKGILPEISATETGTSAKTTQRSKIRGVILLVALSFHMVFDGLAVGLLDDDNAVWTLLLALCVHKILVFLSIGLEIFEHLNSFRKSICLLFCFSTISPVGLVIGVMVTSSEDSVSQAAAAGFLQSLATGTFIYVTFFEILQREFMGVVPDLLKVLCTVVGFAVVAAVKLLEGLDF